MNPDQTAPLTEQSDLGPYCLQYRLTKYTSQWFYFAYFTAKYRLLPNKKKACNFPILEIFPQPEDFIGIYSQIQKAQAVSKNRQ